MNESEFERKYAKRSKTTVKRLHELGLFAVPCDCGNKLCKGWAMITRENLKSHVELYLTEQK